MAPLLLGHRGARASRSIPENTVASFELCLQHGCDGFEFDVRLSGDRQAVICHDGSIGGLSIAATLAERLALPPLEEILRQFAQRAFLDIELKVAGLEALTIACLREHPPQRGYVVSSFLPEVLTAIHGLDHAIPLGLLCETRRQLRNWEKMPAEWIVPQFEMVDADLVPRIHASGKKVMTWTVNRAERIRELLGWGVDAIISDDTVLLGQLPR